MYRLLGDLIDLRSFSNLWYWVALAVFWSMSSHWVLGVPYDMIMRARRDPATRADYEALVGINCRRYLGISRTAAVPLFFFFGFFYAALAMFGFYFQHEFSQAVFMLLAPMLLVGWLTLRTALLIEAGENTGPALDRRMLIHRRMVQVIGMVAIFVTTVYGLWTNFAHSILMN